MDINNFLDAATTLSDAELVAAVKALAASDRERRAPSHGRHAHRPALEN